MEALTDEWVYLMGREDKLRRSVEAEELFESHEAYRSEIRAWQVINAKQARYNIEQYKAEQSEISKAHFIEPGKVPELAEWLERSQIGESIIARNKAERAMRKGAEERGRISRLGSSIINSDQILLRDIADKEREKQVAAELRNTEKDYVSAVQKKLQNHLYQAQETYLASQSSASPTPDLEDIALAKLRNHIDYPLKEMEFLLKQRRTTLQRKLARRKSPPIVKSLHEIVSLSYKKRAEVENEEFAEELPREEVLEEKAVVQVFEKESLTEEQANYPATPDALTGEHMWQKAGELGWPTKWDARQHATHFILGTPKGGTTFVERCYSSGALSGDDHHHPYPKAAMRWPVKFTPDGEPMYKNQGFIGGWAWNRTGYRRWDLAKEWRIYISSGTDETAPKYKKLFSSLPPVEEDSGKWSVLDATPTYLMNPWAADNVHADHQHNPGKLRFVVTWREAMARSFSHFVMIVGKKNQHVKPGAFMARMHSEINHWNKTEGCHVLFDPATLLENADSDITVLRDVLRKCFKPKSFLGHSLPVLGLRYWLHHFKPEQFTVIKTEALKNSDPFFLVGILEKAFGYRRLKPKCSTPAELKSGTCSGELFYTSALDRCRDTGERAASYTKKAGALHLERGTSVEKAPIHALFRLYRKAMSDLIKKYDLAFVNISS